MPKTTRIEIPAADGDLITLAVNIKSKHVDDGKNSPINGLDWDTYGPMIDEADTVNKKIVELTKQAEQLVQHRNGMMSDLSEFVRSSRDVLQGLNRPQLRKLTDWGFEVHDSPKSPAKAQAKTNGNN